MNDTRFDLSDRTVLVTGASSGLGKRFARILAQNGAGVALAARRIDALQTLRDDIEAAGGRAVAVDMDVTDENSVRAGFAVAEAALGPINSIVANAGANISGPAVDLEAAAFDTLLAVNIGGVFLTVREGARRMLATASDERKDGRIIIISSMSASAILPGLAAYSTTKAAVVQLGRVLAREWAGKRINVNSICPGYIETELNADWFQSERGQKQIDKFPRKRLMSEDSLNAMLLYLVSDASAHVTGSVFAIDDGQSLT